MFAGKSMLVKGDKMAMCTERMAVKSTVGEGIVLLVVDMQSILEGDIVVDIATEVGKWKAVVGIDKKRDMHNFGQFVLYLHNLDLLGTY